MIGFIVFIFFGLFLAGLCLEFFMYLLADGVDLTGSSYYDGGDR